MAGWTEGSSSDVGMSRTFTRNHELSIQALLPLTTAGFLHFFFIKVDTNTTPDTERLSLRNCFLDEQVNFTVDSLHIQYPVSF